VTGNSVPTKGIALTRDIVLEVQGLSKSYREVKAVVDVSFSVEAGEVVCLLGPNGSGKTTLIECIEGLRAPDTGTITILGQTLKHSDRRPREVGVQLQEEGLPARISVKEALRLYADIYEVHHIPANLLEQLGLVELKNRRFEKLSGGQKRRTALALAFINNPLVAILDEPTSGLDPQGQRVVVDLLRDRSAAGSGILTTLHDMRVAAEVADKVVVLREGVMLASGPPAALIAGLDYDSCLSLPDTSAADSAGSSGLSPETIADRHPSLLVQTNPDGGVNLYGDRDELTRLWQSLGPEGAAGSNLRSCDLSDLAILMARPVEVGSR
jgi:ABC-2 type transport system ATP-binding protein